MIKLKWLPDRIVLDLQLFAGEGGGGDGGGTSAGAATGEGAAPAQASGAPAEDAARQQRLRELGVPEHVLNKKRAKRPAPRSAATVTTAGGQNEETQVTEQAAAANETPTPKEETTTETPKRMTWEEIMKDPEYNREMQAVVRASKKGAAQAEEALTKLTPALELLARQYKLDPANIDHAALAEAINRDGAYYEARALEMGVPVSEAMQIDNQERNDARSKRAHEESVRDEMHRKHIDSLFEQGKALGEIFPQFDLMTELKNKTFARLTSPGVGISVEEAYRLVHRKEIEAAQQEQIVSRVTEQVTNTIRAGARRPDEAGVSGQSPSDTRFDYSKASPQEREAFKQSLRERMARGEKVYPG